MKALHWQGLALAVGCAAAAPSARADTCSITMSDMVFSNVSPIAGTEYTSTATGTVTCSWTLLSPLPPYLLLFPNVVVCVNVGLGSNAASYNPRRLGNGSNRIDYNLYTAPSYSAASTWGSTGQAGTVPVTLSGGVLPLVGGSIVRNFTVYGRIPVSSSLANAATVGNGDTEYSASFTGFATLNYAFYNLTAPACTAGSSSAFTFSVKATVVNNCTITVAPLAFPDAGTLTSDKRTTGGLSVQCTNNNAWRIALNGGTVANNVAGRRMKNLAGAETIDYRISDALDGALWGDGSGGTGTVSGTGNGALQSVPMYGRVPVQATPVPGSYKDTVTATVYF